MGNETLSDFLRGNSHSVVPVIVFCLSRVKKKQSKTKKTKPALDKQQIWQLKYSTFKEGYSDLMVNIFTYFSRERRHLISHGILQ